MNKRGQYWTPAQGRTLTTWWNTQSHHRKVVWKSEYTDFLDQANLAEDHDLVRPFTPDGLPLDAFLYAVEMLCEQETGTCPCGGIYKGLREERWTETLVPFVIERLGLPLTYSVKALEGGQFITLRKTR